LAGPQADRQRILQEETEVTESMIFDTKRFLSSGFSTEDNKENEARDVPWGIGLRLLL
jgi:hypothetical protein